MGAFILAGIVFVLTIIATVLILFGNMMSDNVADGNSGAFIGVFVTGTVISVVIAATHWLPHIGW